MSNVKMPRHGLGKKVVNPRRFVGNHRIVLAVEVIDPVVAVDTSAGSSACAELPDEIWANVIGIFTAKHGLRAAKMLRKVARVSRLFALHAAAHPDNRLPPPGVNVSDGSWLTDSESDSDDDYMTETMWDVWVD